MTLGPHRSSCEATCSSRQAAHLLLSRCAPQIDPQLSLTGRITFPLPTAIKSRIGNSRKLRNYALTKATDSVARLRSLISKPAAIQNLHCTWRVFPFSLAHHGVLVLAESGNLKPRTASISSKVVGILVTLPVKRVVFTHFVAFVDVCQVPTMCSLPAPPRGFASSE